MTTPVEAPTLGSCPSPITHAGPGRVPGSYCAAGEPLPLGRLEHLQGHPRLVHGHHVPCVQYHQGLQIAILPGHSAGWWFTCHTPGCALATWRLAPLQPLSTVSVPRWLQMRSYCPLHTSTLTPASSTAAGLPWPLFHLVGLGIEGWPHTLNRCGLSSACRGALHPLFTYFHPLLAWGVTERTYLRASYISILQPSR